MEWVFWIFIGLVVMTLIVMAAPFVYGFCHHHYLLITKNEEYLKGEKKDSIN